MSFVIGNVSDSNIPSSVYSEINSNKAKVYGVKFSGNPGDFAGERLYDAKGIKWIPSTYTTAGVDGFANLAPFNVKQCITRYNTTTGKREFVAYKGEDGYDDALKEDNTDVLIEFPKFYYKRPSNYEWLVSDQYISGFSPSPMHYRNGVMHDYVRISKYVINSTYRSIPDSYAADQPGSTIGSETEPASASNIHTLHQYRTNLRARGMYVLDYAAYCSLQILMLVKYANLDISNTVGLGNYGTATSPNTGLRTGSGDSLATMDGGDTTAAGKAVVTLGIENLYGDHWNKVEGIVKGTDGYMYINTDIENITRWPSTDLTGWTKIPNAIMSSGNAVFLNDIAYDSTCPWATFPVGSPVSNQASSRIPDGQWWADNGQLRMVHMGGSRYADGVGLGGPFYFHASSGLSHADWDAGCGALESFY